MQVLIFKLLGFFLLEMFEHIERRLFSDGKPINSTVAIMSADFRIASEIMVMSILQRWASSNVHQWQCLNEYITKQTLAPERMTESQYKEIAEEVHVGCKRLKCVIVRYICFKLFLFVITTPDYVNI